MADPLFIDSWGWLALEDSKDPDHDRAAQFYRAFRRQNGRALTTDYVLDETITLLFRRRGGKWLSDHPADHQPALCQSLAVAAALP